MSLDINQLTARVSDLAGTLRDVSFRDAHNYVPQLPPTLYHYTNAEAFMKIAKGGEIWGTNTRYLNDIQEFSYAHSMAIQAIKTKLHETENAMLKVFLKFLLHYANDLIITFDNYITSFCEESDLLSQWRGYSRGIGYAMGFEPDEQVASMPIGRHCRILSVIYDPMKQREIIQNRIDRHISKLTETGSCDNWFDEATLREIAQMHPHTCYPNNKDEANSHAQQARDLIYEAAASLAYDLFYQFLRMKHSGFSEEREWRFIYTHLDDNIPVEFRTANGYIVPYVKFPLLPASPDSSPTGFKLKHVMCGPCNDPEAAIKSTKMFLRSANYAVGESAGVTVSSSGTPYRTW